MKKWILCIAGIFIMACSKGQSAQKQPNIILIIGDDINWDDLGCYGNKKIRTPNIDRMAREGLRFTHMYLTASSCSPSRSSILTGRYPHNTGAAELHTPLPAHLTYFPELLQKAGYYTAQAGKWHEGKNTKRAYDTLLAGEQLNGLGGEDQWINLLKNRPKDKPFFFWLAPFDAHREWSADDFGQAHDPEKEVWVPPALLDTRETRKDLASYYNEIARIDHYIGELEKELMAEGITDNTLLIFMADNGRPFPGSKTRVYDSGMKTPFVVKWPKGIANKGAVCESLVSSIDIAPTLLELAQASTSPLIQGVSFARLLQNPAATFRTYVFAEHNWHDYEAYERMVRTKDFLYLINKRTHLDNGGPIDANQSPAALALKQARQQERELTPLQNDAFLIPRPAEEFFDCAKDPLQTNNLIQQPAYAKEIARLKKVLAQWQEQTGDTVPAELTPDWYDRERGKALPAKETRKEMPGAARKADKINNKGPF